MVADVSNAVTSRILVFAGADDDMIDAAIRDIAHVTVLRAGDREAACAALAEADALVSADHAWGEDIAAALRAAPRLRWIQLTTAGFDRLERTAIRDDVKVSTIGDAGAGMVSEHAVTLLLALARQVPAMVAAQSRSEWTFADLGKRVRSLRDLKVTVLGFGHTGRAIARLAMAFGAQVKGVARSARRDSATGCEVLAISALHETLADSDAVVITLPLNAATSGLLGQDAFASMKPGAMLVNVSRGRIVVTDALIDALNSGHLAGAAVDVTDPEPLPADHPLWQTRNVLISPHVAWAGGGMRQREIVAMKVVDNVRRFAAGDLPEDLADLAPVGNQRT